MVYLLSHQARTLCEYKDYTHRLLEDRACKVPWSHLDANNGVQLGSIASLRVPCRSWWPDLGKAQVSCVSVEVPTKLLLRALEMPSSRQG